MRNSLATASVHALQITCSHCGDVQEFVQSEPLTAERLERMSKLSCSQCGAKGSVLTFISGSQAATVGMKRTPP